MPCFAIAARCSARSRRARMPPCTAGCSVFTRPSSISGKAVTCSMPMTGMPASRMAAAVPPVEMISQPSSTRPWAKATAPRLSLTEMRARGIVLVASGAGFDWRPAARRARRRARPQAAACAPVPVPARRAIGRCRRAGPAPVPGPGSFLDRTPLPPGARCSRSRRHRSAGLLREPGCRTSPCRRRPGAGRGAR